MIGPDEMAPDGAEPERVLGHAQIEVLDVVAVVAAMRPGEAVRIRPRGMRRRVPVFAVADESWRAEIPA